MDKFDGECAKGLLPVEQMTLNGLIGEQFELLNEQHFLFCRLGERMVETNRLEDHLSRVNGRLWAVKNRMKALEKNRMKALDRLGEMCRMSVWRYMRRIREKERLVDDFFTTAEKPY